MPVRLIREGILTSERVDMLSAPAEVFYRRLLSVVDDFGRYYAKPELLLAAMYPLRIGRVRNADIATWIRCAEEAGLVRRYTANDKDYLEVLDFRQQIRSKVSRFPEPPAAGAMQPLSKCLADATQLLTKTKSKTESYIAPSAVVETDGFTRFWAAYPRKKSKGEAEKVWAKIKPGPALVDRIVSAAEVAAKSRDWLKDEGKFIPHPATWLNAKGWEDEHTIATSRQAFPV